MLKRCFDIIIAALLCIISSPLWLLIALAIKFDSPGPVIFSHPRVGLNGRLFQLYKFRSMVINAADIGPHFTDKNDPRVTRLGRILRKTSLDELPQLLNVLRGNMSLVGPRPDVAEQQSLYTKDEWQKRTSVVPGVTGLAQALKRSSATETERKAYDFEYVDNQSFWLDIKILFLTGKQVIVQGGY